MSALLPVHHWDNILPVYHTTPVADLLAYHNLRTPHRNHVRAELLIGMCMDNRMVDLRARRDVFVNGLVENGGWERQEAERHFDLSSALFEIHDPVEFVLSEAQRLRERYPRVTVAPLFYQVGEGLLHQILEGQGC